MIALAGTDLATCQFTAIFTDGARVLKRLLSGEVVHVSGGLPQPEGAVLAFHALAICQYGPDGIILSANTQYLDYVGMTREELVGQPFINLWRDAGCLADPQAHWSRFAQGKHDECVRKHRRANGRDVWLREVFVPTMDGERLISVLSYAIDVTEEQHERADGSHQSVLCGDRVRP